MEFEWAVVGGGPAGISTVGTLLDEGVSGDAIAWIDPEFNAGDFATLWRNVPSNTRVGDFSQMFTSCRSFGFEGRSSRFSIEALADDSWCDLHYVGDVLRAFTATLRAQVASFVGFVTHCDSLSNWWVLQLRNGSAIRARYVVLAIGARPLQLELPGIVAIPLDVALDRERLPAFCTHRDTVAVFGSSHSAVLAMRILIENCDVAGIVNFHRSPLRYAVQLDDGSWLNYDTGLKGTVAAWAREKLTGTDLPARLERIAVNGDAPHAELARCTKAISAIGFQTRNEPVVNGMTHLTYDPSSGFIAPGLFGCGFGFPEIAPDELGELVPRVGLIRFARFLARAIPLWRSWITCA
jgi:cation diffusion facilitator CzcD-associated flavoprotein CzcO